jgi:hypothetical protein
MTNLTCVPKIICSKRRSFSNNYFFNNEELYIYTSAHSFKNPFNPKWLQILKFAQQFGDFSNTRWNSKGHFMLHWFGLIHFCIAISGIRTSQPQQVLNKQTAGDNLWPMQV